MSRAPSESRDRHRSSSVDHGHLGHLPSRRSSWALEDHSHPAVTRAIYHHAREYLQQRRHEDPSQHRGRQAMLAICQGARAVILESAVVQVIVRCVERTKQLRAKQADEKWHSLGDTGFRFGGHSGLESAKRIAQELGEMLAGFEGDDDVRSRFINVAKSFNQSEVSLRQLQQSFGDNLDGLEAMRNNFDRCTEEVIRLVSLLEGDCASMRVQLHRTLKSPRARMSQNLFGGIESLGQSLLVLENIPQSPEDHISGLLNTLEHDLCDGPLMTMVQVAQDVNDHIVKQLSTKGRMDKMRPCRLSFDANAHGIQFVSPARVIEEMFTSLKPCIFESANKMAEVDTALDLPATSEVEAAVLSAEGGLVSGLVSPSRPSLDLSFARAQLRKASKSKGSKESNSNETRKRKGSRTSAGPNGLGLPGGTAFSGSTGLDKRNDLKQIPTGPHVAEGDSEALSGSDLRLYQKASNSIDQTFPLAASASAPDLPGLVRKDLQPLQPRSVGGHAIASSQNASARELGGDSKAFPPTAESRMSDSSRDNTRVATGGALPMEGMTSVVVDPVVKSHRDASEAGEASFKEKPEDGRTFLAEERAGMNSEQVAFLQPGRPTGRLPDLADDSLPASAPISGRYSNPEAPRPLEGRQAGHEPGLPKAFGAEALAPLGSLSSGPSRGPSKPTSASAREQGCPGEVAPDEDELRDAPAPFRDVEVVRGRGGRIRQRKVSEPDIHLADYSRFMAPSERSGYAEQQSTVNPFMGSPLMVTKSKLEERPMRRFSLTASDQPLEPPRPKLGLPAPMALSGIGLCGSALPPTLPANGLARQGRATSSPMVGLGARPASLDARCKLSKGGSGMLPTLKQVEGQAIVSKIPLHQRKASPARSIGSSDCPDHEMLR